MRPSALRALLMITALLFVVPAGTGCAPGTRYWVLSFFFDGVPPPDGRKPAAAASDARRKGQTVAPSSYRHSPYAENQCDACHQPMTMNLTSPVPQLCFDCHDMDPSKKRFVHAPDEEGVCGNCHDPHLSRNPALLVAPPQEICGKCHDAADVAKTKAHADQRGSCTQCHDPHADSRYFLRSDSAGAAQPAPVDAPAAGN